MKQLLTDEFEDFFEKISLYATQSKRIEGAVDALTDYLRSEYDLKESEVFVQGSFSTDTVVSPPPSADDGEYDVDIVAMCANVDDSPEEALKSLEEKIESNGSYKGKIEKDDPKIPCIRLRYADEENARFHVDIVPAKEGEEEKISIPRKNIGWEISNPKGFTDWVKDRGDRYRRTIMMLKRWRDENEVPIKSIVLQVLVAHCISEADDDAVNIAETTESMYAFLEDLQTPPEICNPTLEEENLTANWKEVDFLQFKGQLEDAVDLITEVGKEEGHDEAAAVWQKIFGEDFPSLKNNLSTECSYNEEYIEDMFPVALSDEYQIKINCLVEQDGFRPTLLSIIKYLSKNKKLTFSVDEKRSYLGESYQLFWKVRNFGEEAKKKEDLRGEITPDKGFLKKVENTRYRGEHYVEAYLVINGKCVVIDRVKVPIEISKGN